MAHCRISALKGVIKYFTFFASKFFSYFPPLKPRCVLWSEKHGRSVRQVLKVTDRFPENADALSTPTVPEVPSQAAVD